MEEVVTTYDIEVPMRDGVVLKADVPPGRYGRGRVVIRTPVWVSS